MKIRTGFISNSSTSNFVLAIDKESDLEIKLFELQQKLSRYIEMNMIESGLGIERIGDKGVDEWTVERFESNNKDPESFYYKKFKAELENYNEFKTNKNINIYQVTWDASNDVLVFEFLEENKLVMIMDKKEVYGAKNLINNFIYSLS